MFSFRKKRVFFHCDLIILICVFCSYGIIQITAQEISCCSKASGSCRNICKKTSIVGMASSSRRLEENVKEMRKYCPIQLVSFWECFNSTINEIVKGQQWSGRWCCSLPQNKQCRYACVTSGSHDEVMGRCKQSDELLFYNCLERQETGDTCCGTARTPDCRQACTAIFRKSQMPSKNLRIRVKKACEERSPKVLQCVRNFTKVTPAKNAKNLIHCCDKTDNATCWETCRNVLNSQTTYQEIIDSLMSGGCGPPLLHDKLWQCFLLSSDQEPDEKTNLEATSRIDRLGMDSAKLQCCHHAISPHCRRLCARTFANDWAMLWETFDRECLSQIAEENLRTCNSEVEEPCELGCDGLNFCTNFNNRPTELFRSCNKHADEAARFDVAFWQSQGNLSILNYLNLPMRNISRCSPNIWRVVACTLQIQPCSRGAHINRICREDCYNILSQCMDWSRIPSEYTAASICAKLSPDDLNDPCISLQPFLEPSDNLIKNPKQLITSPCKNNPCAMNEVCTVNHNCLGRNCLPYTCQVGCKLGKVSQFLVPHGTYVRVPNTNGKYGCLKVCKCVQENIELCQPLPCIPLDACKLGNRKIEHGQFFHVDCNVCSCFAGEIVCSKRQCKVLALGGPDPAFTTLPCNCPPHHVPVCGRNGKTYPSSCLARCVGLSEADFEFGPCKDPCQFANCGKGEICIPHPKVCLSMLHKPCTQYECVNITAPDCLSKYQNTVCDVDNLQYPSPCFVRNVNIQIAHRGHCFSKCSISGPVCGINGVTYSSECTAWADYVSVDYDGVCQAIGLIGDKMKKQCNEEIKCKSLLSKNCIGYTPPGACCPVCAGAMKIIYSRKQIDRALYALKGHSITSLTLQSMLQSLERHIQISECVLRGYLSIESDIFVMVQSTELKPSKLQLDACVREAEKIASLIRRHSPRIASDLSLSALTAATIVHSTNSNNSGYVLYNFYDQIRFYLAVSFGITIFSRYYF
ncbi:reversion-inducing cysteine-rich protein with Kazal motifs [Chrysoperla carnea]|uniref:reversion-inducing cysteine-rich protein with Kazal motifs n=1 Tax=Chrysoperla carnea TaxID=189513 RepID=UPI001D0792E3|nr:reversion-inducing cysteine-rich protein with Kazal motifs [Chrysoperla carnea]